LQVRQTVLAAETLEPQPGASPENKPLVEDFPVVRDANEEVRTLLLRDAAMQLNLVERDVLVFVDAEKNTLSVIYRRKDGNYGLIETGVVTSSA
jgi:putative sigma-54 modulation protein